MTVGVWGYWTAGFLRDASLGLMLAREKCAACLPQFKVLSDSQTIFCNPGLWSQRQARKWRWLYPKFALQATSLVVAIH